MQRILVRAIQFIILVTGLKYSSKTGLQLCTILINRFLNYPVTKISIPLQSVSNYYLLGLGHILNFLLLFSVGSTLDQPIARPVSTHKQDKNKQSPWSESASELYRPSDRRLSAKWLPTFVYRWCHVVSVTDPYGRFPLFLSSSSSVVLTRLVDLVPDPLLFFFPGNLVVPGIEPGPPDL
jgi:hypothetical protein